MRWEEGGGGRGEVIYFGCVTNGVGSDCFYYKERQCSVLLRTMERERKIKAAINTLSV